MSRFETYGSQRRRGVRPGFTLLEALVALTLGAVITAGVGIALRTGLDASQRLQERSEQHAEARAALAILERDLAAAFLSEVNPHRTFFRAEPPAAAAPGEPFLSFTTLSHRGRRPEGARSDAVRVEYLLQPAPDDARGSMQLVRRERWLTSAGDGTPSVVCDRVAGLQLRYAGASARGASPGDADDRWTASPTAPPELTYRSDEPAPPTPSARRLPRAVEIMLLLAPPPDRSDSLPRVYHTRVLLHADAERPFEPEEEPPPSAAQPAGTSRGAGQPGGGHGQ